VVTGVVLSVAALATIAFAPGLAETRIGRAVRFWQPVAPPEPAVPPGALASEIERRDSEAEKTAAIAINPATVETLGIQSAAVEYRVDTGGVRTTGRIVADERSITTVTSKVDGWIEQTFANFDGQEVRAGQPLFTIYSPDVLATENEYLIAIHSNRDFATSEFDVVRESGPALVDSARRRLELWGLTPDQIAELERTGRATRALTVFAPHTGVVTERKAYPGTRVVADTALYTLADLSRVWVEADVFESDLPSVRVGTTGEITLPGGETRATRITFINPLVDAQSRTAKVRLEVSNPGRRMLPGMYVDVTLNTIGARRLVVPRDAVFDTGMHKLAFAATSDGGYVLREITTGAEGQDSYEVLSGLNAGDRVARRVQFLIDSESDLGQRIDRAFPFAPARGAEQPVGGTQ
jgi:Cu(I)/Ag(I) efflux system membrane fusion protein